MKTKNLEFVSSSSFLAHFKKHSCPACNSLLIRSGAILITDRYTCKSCNTNYILSEIIASENKAKLKSELYKLLNEMTPSMEKIDSLKDPVWHAHRRAEQLSDEKLLSLICEIIKENPNKDGAEVRRNAYFVLGKLLKKHTDPKACQLYIDSLQDETDKYMLHSMLDNIQWLNLPSEVCVDPIINYTQSEKWLVRHSAINALRASNTESSREAVRYWVGQEDAKKYKYELIYANASLGFIGTPEDISLLEKHTHSRIRDVRDTANYAINNIRQRYALSND